MKDKEEVIIDGKAWVERYKSAYNAQANWRELWNDCRRYVMPQDTESYNLTESKTEGERRAYPVNSTAVDLCEKMASGMHSATVSYGDRWFTLTGNGGGELMSRWCSQATRLCIHAMQESNYLSASSDMIKYFCAYGTAILFIGEGEDGLPKYRNIPITNNVCIETDEYGEANVVYVGYFYTARQAVSMFGENAVSPAVRNAYRAELKTGNVGKKFEFVHVTYPKKLFNEPVETKRAALTRADELKQLSEEYRPWGGLFIEKDTGAIVRREGFHEFPFVVPRFMLSNDESYGRSIPMLAMPTIKTLNEAMAVMIDASKMAVRPPIGVPTSLPKLDLRPGAITKVNMSAAAQIWTYTTQASIPVGEKLIELLTNELRSMFKEDFFMAISKRGEMSATEVAERVRQASEFISPIVMNLQHFGFRPAVMRTLAILERSKRIPKRPDTGGTFDISFVSRIDSMIRQSESSRIMQFLQQAATVGQLTAANPDLQNVVDLDKVYDELAVAMGVDASIVFDVGKRMESRAAQAQAQAEAMRQQMQAEMMAKTDMTKSIDPNSILGQMDEAA